MAAANLEIIIDGDGHVMEDTLAIVDHMPPAYKEIPQPQTAITNPFPPLDHLHSAFLCTHPPGAFRKVGVDGWMDFIQDVGINTAVLYPTQGLTIAKVVSRNWAIDVTRAYNDWFYETYLTKSPRFKGMGLIPLQEPEAAVEELRRIVQDLGMCGAFLPSSSFKGHLGSKEYWPVYAEAERLGCCLGIHGGSHENFGMDDLSPFGPVLGLGHPFGLMISLTGLVFNGIFDRYPNIRIGFLEGGVGWFLTCLERFTSSWATHIEYDPRGELLQLQDRETAGEYVIRQVKAGRIYVGVEGDEPLLAHACKVVGSEPFIFSSDFPHEVNNETCKEELREMRENEELSDEDKAAILHGNAERFYNLTPISS